MKKDPESDEDLLADLDFDLIDEDEAEEIFARDTAIPTLPPDELAAEAMASLRIDSPRLPPRRKPASTPPKRPITLDPPPPSEELEFEDFGHAVDMFGHSLPGGAQGVPSPDGAPDDPRCDVPTSPPDAGHDQRIQSARRDSVQPSARGRRRRNAFLIETRRNPAFAEAHTPRPLTGDSQASDFANRASRPSHSASERLVPFPSPVTAPPPAPSELMEREYGVGNYTRALELAEDILARSPDDVTARRYAQNCRDVLTQMLSARVGPLDQVVRVVVSNEELQWLSLDHRSGFLLSLVDGQSTLDEILDISGMTRLDALRIIVDLKEQRVVRVGSV